MNNSNISIFNYKTFEDISYDKSNNEYLVNSKEQAIDFDDFVQNLDVNTYRSVDAIYFKNNKMYLIEFKNKKITYPDTYKEIVDKFKDSITILLDNKITGYEIVLIIVTNAHKNKNLTRRHRLEMEKYKRRLFYYVNNISKTHYSDVRNIKFRIMNEKEFNHDFS